MSCQNSYVFYFSISLHIKIIFLESVSQVKKDIAINTLDNKFIDITWEYYPNPLTL